MSHNLSRHAFLLKSNQSFHKSFPLNEILLNNYALLYYLT